MAEQWEVYVTQVNDALASVLVDLGYADEPPPAGYTTLLFAFLNMLKPRENGLPSREESPRLTEIEEALMDAAKVNLKAICVGLIGTAGRREIYFYAQTAAGFEECVRRVMARFPEYSCKHGDQSDPEWSQYCDVLTPGHSDWRQILDTRLVRALQERGDDNAAARHVSHWVYFADENARTAFRSDVAQLGFEFVEEVDESVARAGAQSRGRRFGIVVRRADSVALDHITCVTGELLEIAMSHGGQYDGWECEVVPAHTSAE